VIRHGVFSLIDAFPFQWGQTGGGECALVNWAAACAASVSIPASERSFGQGVRAHFDNFTVTTRADD
jgi:hypothetical protein